MFSFAKLRMTKIGVARSLSAALPLVMLCLVAARPAQAQTYTVLHSFTGAPSDGAFANGELVQDAAGNLYGTTSEGGTHNDGTVFKLDPGGVVTILHSFDFANDGVQPAGGLLLDAKGNLYGTTPEGGHGGQGTVFRIDTDDVFKTLYSFKGGSDGGWPRSRLVTINGDLYGTTTLGGDLSECGGEGCGTIFKLSGSTETVLYNFSGGTDGARPQGLIRDAAGNLYGVAEYGGIGAGTGAGTVWKLDINGAFVGLYAFTGGSDGGTPQGRLVRDNTNGTLRGVTWVGGDPVCNCGVVFSVDLSGHETVIHKFFGYGGGGLPFVGLLDVDGILYGTTSDGGDLNCNHDMNPRGCGVLYQIGKTGQYDVIHSFEGATEGDAYYNLFGGLSLGTDGSIYGATYFGGTGTCKDYPGCGVIFKYTP